MAPFTEPHTAKTLGKGNNEWAGVLGAPQHGSVSYHRGINDRLDLGVLFEYQNISLMIGINGKYLLTPDETHRHLSLIFGGGLGTGYYAYIGPVFSSRFTSWYELTTNLRMNVFNWDISTADEQETQGWITDLINDSINDLNGTHTYASLDISNTFWFKDNLGLTISTTGLFFWGALEGSGLKGGLKLHYKY